MAILRRLSVYGLRSLVALISRTVSVIAFMLVIMGTGA